MSQIIAPRGPAYIRASVVPVRRTKAAPRTQKHRPERNGNAVSLQSMSALHLNADTCSAQADIASLTRSPHRREMTESAEWLGRALAPHIGQQEKGPERTTPSPKLDEAKGSSTAPIRH